MSNIINKKEDILNYIREEKPKVVDLTRFGIRFSYDVSKISTIGLSENSNLMVRNLNSKEPIIYELEQEKAIALYDIMSLSLSEYKDEYESLLMADDIFRAKIEQFNNAIQEVHDITVNNRHQLNYTIEKINKELSSAIEEISEEVKTNLESRAKRRVDSEMLELKKLVGTLTNQFRDINSMLNGKIDLT